MPHRSARSDSRPEESAPLIPIHPQLVRAARWLPRHITNRVTLRPQRVIARGLQAFTRRPAAPLRVTATSTVTLFRPSSADDRKDTGEPRPAVLWIHGGGYVAGDVRQDVARCQTMADETGAVVAAVSYRKAPEHPYPAALDDCLAALRALRQLPGVDAERVAIAGASAGGGLAAALALRARDVGVPLAGQLLLYPMLDDRTVPPGSERNYRVWDRRSNDFAWDAYLRNADRDAAVPARTMSLTGLAEAWVGVGTNDLFFAENRAYVAGLRAAAVPCELVEVPGAWHAFDGFVPGAAISRDFFDRQHRFLRRVLR